MTLDERPPSAASDDASTAGVDAAAYKSAARQFVTGVTVATVMHEGTPHAITATAFVPLSLDPPLVLIALDRAGRLLGFVREAGCFGVSVLGTQHRALSEWAAIHGRDRGMELPDTTVTTAVTGAPLVADAVAWFDCVLEQENVHGDHALVVGRVVGAASDGGGDPLLYARGGYHRLGVPHADS